VTKPPPDHIDRYVPGQRSPRRRNDTTRTRGRRPGERGEPRSRTDSAAGGRQTTNGRPKKTQEELDAEMDDYWSTTNTNGNANDATLAPPATEAPAPAPATAADDDIDMIE
jgi:THO complex subunit 4